MSMYREPQSDRAQSPPISSSVVGSFNSTASVRAAALPTAASLNLSSGSHIFWNASGGGLSVSSYCGDICAAHVLAFNSLDTEFRCQRRPQRSDRPAFRGEPDVRLAQPILPSLTLRKSLPVD